LTLSFTPIYFDAELHVLLSLPEDDQSQCGDRGKE